MAEYSVIQKTKDRKKKTNFEGYGYGKISGSKYKLSHNREARKTAKKPINNNS